VCPNVMVDELKSSLQWITHARFDDKSDQTMMRLMAYRKLNMPAHLQSDVASKLEELANQFDGRAYENNFGEIVESIAYQDSELCCKPKKETQVSEDDQEKRLAAVFCSELVAAMLMKAGVMDRGQFANRYMPHDFSAAENAKACPERGQGHMVDGFKFGAEVEIVGATFTDEKWDKDSLLLGKTFVRHSTGPIENRSCGPARGCCLAPEETMHVEPKMPRSNFSTSENEAMGLHGFSEDKAAHDTATTIGATVAIPIERNAFFFSCMERNCAD